ncbi:hypothetical protein K1X25_09585, partial [Campylobacter jejuni]
MLERQSLNLKIAVVIGFKPICLKWFKPPNAKAKYIMIFIKKNLRYTISKSIAINKKPNNIIKPHISKNSVFAIFNPAESHIANNISTPEVIILLGVT